MNNTDVLEVSRLCVRYGQRTILKHIDLRLAQEEILVVIGLSGSGKTTLIRSVLGLIPIQSGNIRLLKQDVSSLDRKERFALNRKVGVAFQNGALLSSLTVRENVELPLHYHSRLDRKTIRIMARMKLDMMGMLEAQDLMPSELSGGMLKRAGLARAVTMEPSLLFFDEPSAGLDPIHAAELDELMLRLQKTLRISMLVVTHDMQSAFRIADRIMILHDGEAIMTAPPATIQASQDPRIRNMVQRKSTARQMDAEQYLAKLTEDTNA